jgi:hypothetical protein
VSPYIKQIRFFFEGLNNTIDKLCEGNLYGLHISGSGRPKLVLRQSKMKHLFGEGNFIERGRYSVSAAT